MPVSMLLRSSIASSGKKVTLIYQTKKGFLSANYFKGIELN
jgi:hypothetical protein